MPDPILEMVTRIAAVWLNNPGHRIEVEELPNLLQRIYQRLAALAVETSVATPAASGPLEYIPAVSVKESLASKDYIVSMIDGKPYKALRRHAAAHGLTPEEYRARYRFHPTYPMIAENHSATRREVAKGVGLGALRKKR
jgi:predicted transcriptional regulator